MNGYLYRICPTDEARLRTLVGDYVGVGPKCWSFGGAALWDFDPGTPQMNLRPISLLQDVASLDLRGDFGHAFSARAEVRWKRYDQQHYDVLVLSEQPLSIADAQTLAAGWVTIAVHKRAILQSGDVPSLSYIAYYAPNGAIQFLRYKEVGP